MLNRPRVRLPAATILFVILVLFAVVGGCLASVWRGHEEYREARRSIQMQDAAYAHTLARGVQQFLASSSTTVSTMAGEAAVVPALTREHLQPLVERFALANQDTFISLYVIGIDGVEIADFYPSGKTADEQLAGIGVDLKDRTYLRRVIDEKRPFISEVVIGRSTKRPVIVVASPILDAAGSVVAVAAGSLDLTALSDMAAQAGGASSQKPVIIDATGKAVVHDTQGTIDQMRDLHDIAPAKQALQGARGAVESYVDPDGHSYSAAYEGVAEFGWGVWVARDAASLRGAIADAAQEALVTFAFVLLFAGLAFAAVSHFLFLPLRRMTDHAERIAAGKFESALDLSGTIPSREMQTLAESLSSMASHIKDMTEKMKNDFLFRTIHDLRSPLTFLGLALEAHQEEENKVGASPELTRGMENMRDASSRMAKLIEDLLDIAKGEKSEITLKKEPVNLGDVLALSMQQHETEIRNKKLRVQFESGDASVEALGDHAALCEVFDNLVSNAVKYNRDAGTLSVAIHATTESVMVTVSDTGKGISPKSMGKLFTPYFRDADPDIKGTGLGLYIVKNFIVKMGGKVSATSKEGEGTTFEVSLPRA